jgi:peptidoglycan hydrolase-like protein with peptidoglycan-binding domain
MLQSPENLLTPYAARRHPSTSGGGAGGWFDLDDWVGPGRPSTRADIAKLEAILANSGDFPMERFQGPTGYWGGALDQGIRAYQKRNGLKVDGALRPGGPTISHMRDSFAGLLAGYAPPTVADIDAHQNVVGNDNPGTIAWCRPRFDWPQLGDLPEIDQAADASNARLVRAMLRTGDIEGYAPLMRDAIDQGGKHALAEVRDLTQKLDEASPGLGGRFAGYVFDGMEKAKRDRLQIKMQGGQPLGTVQVAMLRPDGHGNIGGRPQILNESGRGGGLGLGGGLSAPAAAKYLSDQFKLPGFTPSDNENKPAQTPPPALVDLPIHTGHPASEPVGPNSTAHPAPTPGLADVIQTPPQSPEDRRKEISDLVGQYLEIRIFGGRRDYRGTDLSIDSTTEAAKICAEEAAKSDLPELLQQKGGGNRDGEEREYMPEVTLKKGGRNRRSDYAIALKSDHDPKSFGHINIYTPKADGTPIAREVSAYLDMLNMVDVPDLVAMVPKMQPGEDVQNYRENILRPACRKIIDAKIRKLRGQTKVDE